MNDEIVLYSIGCPQCTVLKMKLDRKGIEYRLNDSVEEMQALGITSAPVLSVNGELKKFSEAVRWVGEQ